VAPGASVLPVDQGGGNVHVCVTASIVRTVRQTLSRPLSDTFPLPCDA